MKKIFVLLSFVVPVFSISQNVGIGTTLPTGRLQINHRSATTSGLKLVDSTTFAAGAIEFNNVNNTSRRMLLTGYSGSSFYKDQYVDVRNDSTFIGTFRGNGMVGIRTDLPSFPLDVDGDINTSGSLRINGNPGTAGQVLTSTGTSAPVWTNATSGGGGSVGFGPWGDCSTNAISEYNPVADATGAVGDQFGSSVSISGNYAIVGAYNDDVGANTSQGSVSIYQYNGANWVLMQKITDATGAAGDQFGVSVSISDNYAIVGAYSDDVGANSNQGSGSIYQFNGTNWILMQKITDVTGAASDRFGSSVCISGNYAIVGAYNDDVGANTNQGSASIYQYNGTNWILMQKITDATGAADDEFGISVSISGNYAIVGAEGDDVGFNANQGSASIYQWNGTNWVLMNKITDAVGDETDFFGTSVSISDNYAIVGADEDDNGVNTFQGSASIYRYNGTIWVLMIKITDPAGAVGDLFGSSVSISGNYAIVGARGDQVVFSGQGSATIYQRVGLGWQKLQYVTDPGGNVSDSFGGSTAFDGTTKRFLIGVDRYANSSGKVVFGKVN